jgi:hypothetical protein
MGRNLEVMLFTDLPMISLKTSENMLFFMFGKCGRTRQRKYLAKQVERVNWKDKMQSNGVPPLTNRRLATYT